MGDLIPTHLGLDNTACSKLRRSVTNISEWLQAFAVYVSLIVKKQPHRVPDLIGYQILILEASNEYRNDCWLGYDRRFRQQAASRSNCKWSDMDSTLWNMVFTGRTGQCGYCFSLYHASKDCELASDKGMNVKPRYLRSSCTMSRPYRLICHHWNVKRTPNCSFPNCHYEHICSLCTFNPEATDIHHKAVYCPCCLNQARSRPLTTGQPQLHLYFPKATTCPDNTKHTTHTINTVMITYTTPLHPYLILYVSIITYCVSTNTLSATLVTCHCISACN